MRISFPLIVGFALLACEDKAPVSPEFELTRASTPNWSRSSEAWTLRHATWSVRRAPEAIEFGVATGPQLRFALPVLSRGVPLGRSDERTTTSASGHLVSGNDAFREELVASAEGLELRWEFAETPPGHGPLEVRIPTDAAHSALEMVDGLILSVGQRRVHVSNATWIDARGVRTVVPARLEGGVIRYGVDEETLAASTWPAVLDPLISPEFGMDVPVIGLTQGGAQLVPAIAFSGSHYLAVWVDGRAGAGAEVVATRIARDGQVLDAPALYLGFRADGRPSVSWDGTNFLAVGHEIPPFAPFQADIVGALVSPDGGVVRELVLSALPSSQHNPSVASSGNISLVVWVDSGDVYGLLVDALGQPVGAEFPIATGPGLQNLPAVTWDGTEFVVAWEDSRSGPSALYAARVSELGVVVDPNGRQLTPSGPNAVTWTGLSSNGASTIAVWHDVPAFGIWALRLAWDGGSEVPVLLGDAGVYPQITWNGSNFQVAWARSENLRAARVDPSGGVLDPGGIPIGAGSRAAVASDGTSTTVVFANRELFAVQLGANGEALDGSVREVSFAANHQDDQRVATNGAEFLSSWIDYRDPVKSSIRAVNVAVDGGVRDPSGLLITDDVFGFAGHDVACLASTCLAAWTRTLDGGNAVFVGRIDVSSGTVLDPAGIRLSPQSGDSAVVATDGTTFAVVWNDRRSNPARLFAARVTPAGVVLDPNGVLLSASGSAQPRIVWGGQNYFVTWLEAGAVAGRWVDASLALLNDGGLTLPTGSFPFFPRANFLAASGSTTLLGWQHDGRVFVSRVDPGGFLTEPGGILVADAGYFGNAAWNGTNFVVATLRLLPGAIEVRRLSADLVVRDPQPLVIATYAGVPAIACVDGRCLATYWRTEANPNIGAIRVFGKIIAETEPRAHAASLTTSEDTPLPLTLSGDDPNADALVASVVTPPAHGSLSGSGPNRLYTPAANFSGADEFTFVVTDGTETSRAARVSLTVTPVNDAPVASPLNVSTPEDTPIDLVLGGTDVEGSALSFSLATQPSNGTLSGIPPSLRYSPTPDFNGSDSVTFVVNDGTTDSASAVVTLTVTAVNDAPTALPLVISTEEGVPVTFTLTGTDPDGDALTFALVTQPARGQLSGTPPTLTFSPAPGFSGDDSFTYKARDSALDSPTMTVSLHVTSAPDAGTDAGAADAGYDAGATDAGYDAGTDGGFDAGSDAGTDAGAASSTDAGADAGYNAGADAGAEDAGFEAGTDAGAGQMSPQGCSCRTSPIGSSEFWVALLAMLKFRRRPGPRSAICHSPGGRHKD